MSTTTDPITSVDREWLAEDPKRRLVRHHISGRLGWAYAGEDVPAGYEVVEVSS